MAKKQKKERRAYRLGLFDPFNPSDPIEPIGCLLEDTGDDRVIMNCLVKQYNEAAEKRNIPNRLIVLTLTI